MNSSKALSIEAKTDVTIKIRSSGIQIRDYVIIFIYQPRKDRGIFALGDNLIDRFVRC